MRYLLSNGRSTEDQILYIKDLILINMKLLPKEIPYFNGGSDELIANIEESKLEDNLTRIMNGIIQKVEQQNPGVSINLDDISVTNSIVTVFLKINGIEERYDIKRYYQGRFD
jgi:hypothetical protein